MEDPHLRNSKRKNPESSEAAIEQGLEATMEYLQKPTRREGLAPALAQIRTGNPPILGDSDVDSVYRKKEANAISGYFMVPIWAQAKKSAAEHPGKIGSYRKNEKGRKVFEVKSLEETREKLAHDPRSLLLDLYQSSIDTLSWQVARFVSQKRHLLGGLAHSETPREAWPRDARIFARYDEVLQDGVELQGFRVDPKKLLQAGFMAAQVVSWATIEGIPRLYQKHFGRPISDDQLALYIEKGRMMALYMASMHIDVFRPFISETLQRHEDGQLEPLPIFNDSVQFDPNGKFPFAIEKETLQKIVRDVEKLPQFEGPRTGCPAIAARDANGNNLVTDIYKSAVDLAQQYYFPVAIRERDS